MEGSLTGRSILIVEDEPLIVMDITQAFAGSGAELTTTNTLRHALLLVEHDGLSAAILDHALGDGDSSLLYARLRKRGVPLARRWGRGVGGIFISYRREDAAPWVGRLYGWQENFHALSCLWT
jgi:CheY-like chemotaxis protein